MRSHKESAGGRGEGAGSPTGAGGGGGEFASFSPEYLFVGLHLNSPSITINLGLSINLKQVPYVCQDTIHALSLDESMIGIDCLT